RPHLHATEGQTSRLGRRIPSQPYRSHAIALRLDRGIQYAAAYQFNQNRLGALDRPIKSGDDTENGATIVSPLFCRVLAA
ncbi:hypothetical protein, partial [Bradyrhizobium guangzhouense]|uniref:hypothetical protein n=1 Tax=Bradyrhizobium guangzhouense TaxID=1325095 RepID=UPI001009C94A